MMNRIHFPVSINSHRKVGVLFLIFSVAHYNRGYMKKSSFFVLCILYFVFGTAFGYSSDDAARANLIAQAGLIVSHEDIASFRLDDTMLRQELIGTALKLSGKELPTEYQCQ